MLCLSPRTCIDVRFPLLHYPPSLRHYLRTLKPNPKPAILVLTKTDLVPAWVAEAWQRYFEEEADLAMSTGSSASAAGAGEGELGKIEVVLMESYREKEMREETQGELARCMFSSREKHTGSQSLALQPRKRASSPLLPLPPGTPS